MQHPDEGTIHAWIDGALSEDEASAIERHVAECPACAEQVAEARGMIAGASRIVSSLDVVRGNVIPTSPALASGSMWRRLHLTPSRAALAATVLLAVGSMLAVRDRGRGDAATGRLVDSPIPNAAIAAPAMAPAPAAGAAAAPPRETRLLPEAAVPKGSEHRRKADAAVANGAPAAIVAGAATAQTTTDSQRPTSNAQRSLAEAVVTAAPAAAPAPAPATAPQRAARRAEAKTAGMGGNMAAEPRAMDVGEPSQALAGGRTLANVVDVTSQPSICYQIVRDTATWLRSIPLRFTLARDTLTHRNVVRTFAAAPQRDSTIPGSNWSATPGSSYRVTLPTDQPNQPISIVLTATEPTAQASWGTEVRQLGVRRAPCPR